MIQTEDISQLHTINSKTPDYLIKLPLKQNEVLDLNDVTCYFVIQEGSPFTLKCVGVDYFKNFNNSTLKNYKYKSFTVTYIYIFKGMPFDIEKEKTHFTI